MAFTAAAPLLALEWEKLPVASGTSIREAVVMNPGTSASCSSRSLLLSCPRCGLTIRPKVHWLAIEHCPRCLAHARVAVTLISAAPAGGRLHDQRPAFRAARPGTQAVDGRRPR